MSRNEEDAAAHKHYNEWNSMLLAIFNTRFENIRKRFNQNYFRYFALAIDSRISYLDANFSVPTKMKIEHTPTIASAKLT